MIPIRISIAILLILVALPAGAQKAPPSSSRRLYCWEDQSGRRTCSDTLPPEAMVHAREEISAKSGIHLSSVDRQLTPEERAIKALEDAQREAEAAAAVARRRTDEIMLRSYQNENELRRVFDESINMADNNIKTALYNRNRLRENLLVSLRTAARSELSGDPVSDTVNATIQKQHTELLTQLQLLQKLERRRVELDDEIQTTLKRYRDLKSQHQETSAVSPSRG